MDALEFHEEQPHGAHRAFEHRCVHDVERVARLFYGARRLDCLLLAELAQIRVAPTDKDAWLSLFRLAGAVAEQDERAWRRRGVLQEVCEASAPAVAQQLDGDVRPAQGRWATRPRGPTHHWRAHGRAREAK